MTSFDKTIFVGIDATGKLITVHRVTAQLYANGVPVEGAIIKDMKYRTGKRDIPGVLQGDFAPRIIYPSLR